MKKYIKVLSVFLAVVMAAMMPAQALSAVRSTKYISEIVTVAAGSFEEAKEKLEAEGYKIVENSNLNSSLKTGVYLGYKETTEKKEAITDIAAMNMTGKFSYSDYDQIMKDYKENITETVYDLETSIEEFQQNYANEKKNAKMACSALNLFRDDDSGKLMGEYFFDYDFSEGANKKLTDTLMQANSDIVVTMIRSLTFAADPDDTTFIDRMTKTGPDGIEERYAKAYQTMAKARQAMAKEYGSVADSIYKDWDAFYDYLCEIEENTVVIDGNGNIDVNDDVLTPDETEQIDTEEMTADEQKFIEAIDELAGSSTVTKDSADFLLYSMLADTPFGEGTLLDYFKRPAAEVDKSELYVIVDSLSDGQKNQIGLVGIKDILSGAFSDTENDEETEETVDEYTDLTEAIEPVSIFTGVDRSIFEDGVAFTSNAVQHEQLTGESWLHKLSGVADTSSDYWNTATIACWTATAALFGVGMAAAVTQFVKQLPYLPEKRAAEAALKRAQKAMVDKLKQQRMICKELGGDVIEIDVEHSWSFRSYRQEIAKCEERLDDAREAVNEAGRTASIVKGAAFILMVIALVIDIVTIIDFITEEKPTEETIPHHLMTTAMTAYGEDYVYYQTAKTLSGDAADTNNHEADASIGWLVLYTTKDANAGDPIAADDIKVVTGSTDFGEDASFAHLFNETAPVNLTDPNYTGAPDKIDGTYIVFDRTGSAYTGSAISNGAAAIIAAAALAVGAAGGSIITSKTKRKKEA